MKYKKVLIVTKKELKTIISTLESKQLELAVNGRDPSYFNRISNMLSVLQSTKSNGKKE